MSFVISTPRQGAAARLAHRFPLSALALIAALGGSPSAALAQTEAPVEETESAAESTPTDDSALALPEVTATAPRESGYAAERIASATKTDTPLSDIPQSISVVTQALVRDQAALSIGEAVRYVPGVGMAQGEGNRETPILRGNSTTADFFLDGLRDDVQYYRDLYNIAQLEVLKGPNAMIFGRGGVGGVINRVTRQADFERVREIGVQAGSFDSKRTTIDVGDSLGDRYAARVTAVYEDSESYRDGVTLDRFGINPTAAVRLAPTTLLRVGYEYFHDQRVADRGVPSSGGRPFQTNDHVFFGDPANSPTDTELNVFTAVLEHGFSDTLSLRSALRYGNYNKFYQNVYASSAVNGAGNVTLEAYNQATARDSLFSQTDLVAKLSTGSIQHTLLSGLEIGQQDTRNLRLTGFFPDGPDGDALPDQMLVVPAATPTISQPLTWAPRPSDGHNVGLATVVGVYVQDQIEWTPQWLTVIGLRYDSFQVDFDDIRATGAGRIEASDDLLSPRAGVVYKPVDALSLYLSYTLSYLPRSGEQMTSLTPTANSFEPEKFENYEFGAKWQALPDLALTGAVYRLNRSNVIIPSAIPGGPSTLGDGQRIQGLELGAAGKITALWSLIGGYAYQDGRLTATTGATTQNGAALAQLPKHSWSLWNRYDFTPKWGAGLGVVNRSEMYTSTSNTVVLDGYTRVDGALFVTLSDRVNAQVNVENLLGEDYFLNAHNDNNITPGSPRAVRVGLTATF